MLACFLSLYLLISVSLSTILHKHGIPIFFPQHPYPFRSKYAPSSCFPILLACFSSYIFRHVHTFSFSFGISPYLAIFMPWTVTPHQIHPFTLWLLRPFSFHIIPKTRVSLPITVLQRHSILPFYFTIRIPSLVTRIHQIQRFSSSSPALFLTYLFKLLPFPFYHSRKTAFFLPSPTLNLSTITPRPSPSLCRM